MGKILPLVGASLKNFMRNWKSVILLIVFPLILIGSIFLSFNPDGIQKIPVGVINNQDLEISEFTDAASYFLKVTEFDDLGTCTSELKKYNQYACINVVYNNYILLNVNFDNTREPIIWEVVQRIKSAVDYLQKEKSKEMAYSMLDSFKDSVNEIDEIKGEIKSVNIRIKSYINSIDASIDEFDYIKEYTLDSMDEIEKNIDQIDNSITSIEDEYTSIHNSNMNDINYLQMEADSITTVDGEDFITLENIIDTSQDMEIDNTINNNLISKEFQDTRNYISHYRKENNEIKQSIGSMDSSVFDLEYTKEGLSSIKDDLDYVEKQIVDAQEVNQIIDQLDPELLINPIIVRNNQTYIPKVEEYIIGKTFRKNNNETEENLLESIVKGINLIGLQTLYPNILILIVMFLSLLISSFISLNEINSTATQRHNLIRGIFFPEIISVYFSSLIVISIPLICIVLLGQYLFRLQIFQNALYISMILLLLISIFILLGMALSYLIKKESITLLISTFILVFLVFFSGFMLPIERMSNTANIVASNSPSTISLSAFNRIIFYSQGFEVIAPNVYQLIIWFGTLLLLTTLIKSMKK